jgi:23S rRNA (cytidine1920-2'-O)/16S rRNA (cytidine1409-2'-O)-methyltransferase
VGQAWSGPAFGGTDGASCRSIQPQLHRARPEPECHARQGVQDLLKKRIDVLLVERGLAQSRAQAQALLMSGRVRWGERRLDKPGTLVPASAELNVRAATRFVSRGGAKLEGALEALGVQVAGAVAVDIGASTGGFTDCLLQRGAARVFAVDVGRGQLAPKLRADPRVVVMERTNARYLSAQDFDTAIDLVVADASFISLDRLLPAIADLLPAEGRLLALVKPQFEAGPAQARRARGVIRDHSVRETAIAKAKKGMERHGFELLGECDSPLRGPKGNLERFVLARRCAAAG